jgi:hypothetical protein
MGARGVPVGPRLMVVAVLALALAASLAIAACGGGGIESSGGGKGKVETVKVSGKPSGNLTISNWPLYIDKNTVPRLREGDRRLGQVHRGRQ